MFYRRKNKKNFFLSLANLIVVFSSCSFDNKSGIWIDKENENKSKNKNLHHSKVCKSE